MKRILLTTALALGGCASSEKSAQQKVVLTGSSTIAPFMSEIAKAYEAKHPDVRVDVQTGGSSRGIADAQQGLAQIGMTSRSLKADEVGLVETKIAMDGVCFLVHKDNPVNELTNEQIVAIYTKKITDWKEVGGKPGNITVINRAEGRSELELFQHHFKLKATDMKADVIAGENQHGIKTVTANVGAIVYMSVGTSEYEVEHGTPIKMLPLGGVPATIANVRDGTFPFSRPLVLVAKPDAAQVVKDLIDYTFSPEAQKKIESHQFVPVPRENT